MLTIILLPITFFALISIIQWVFVDADWRVVTQFPLLYAVGQYPRDEIWRVGIGLSAILFMLGASWGKWGGLLRFISIAFGLAFAAPALLPVQHPELDLSMRIYLGTLAFFGLEFDVRNG